MLWLAVLSAVLATNATAAPKRIVSLNACADEYLIALADKSQIAALTQFARDPQFSFFADQAKAYPYTRGQAEAVLALHPDLVIASPYRRADTLSLVQGRVEILDLKPTQSFEDIVEQTRLVAKAIGQPERGEALIRSMKARVDAAGRRPIGGVAVQYQRNGFISGPGSLIDDLMTRAGLINLARVNHTGSLGQMSLEQIVYARPDFLVLSEGAYAGQDEGSLIMEHPALARVVPEARRIHVPSAFTVCGGPSYPDALERMQGEADRAKKVRR
jgi:iron complex transport system substrate-binding protein